MRPKAPHMSNAIIDWDLRTLPTTRHTPLTGDVRTVAVPNDMQTAPFQMMDRRGGDMLDPGFPTSQMPDRFLVSELSVMTFILLVGGVEPLVSPQPPTDLLYDAVMNQWTVTCRTD